MDHFLSKEQTKKSNIPTLAKNFNWNEKMLPKKLIKKIGAASFETKQTFPKIEIKYSEVSNKSIACNKSTTTPNLVCCTIGVT